MVPLISYFSGLLERWYDTCVGFVNDVTRKQSLTFGIEYMKENVGHFYVNKQSTFDETNISGKKIGKIPFLILLTICGRKYVLIEVFQINYSSVLLNNAGFILISKETQQAVI